MEQKLDTLSAGLLNMLQAAQQQMDSKAVEASVDDSPEEVDSLQSEVSEKKSGRADCRSPRHKAEQPSQKVKGRPGKSKVQEETPEPLESRIPKVKQSTPAPAHKKSPKPRKKK